MCCFNHFVSPCQQHLLAWMLEQILPSAYNTTHSQVKRRFGRVQLSLGANLPQKFNTRASEPRFEH